MRNNKETRDAILIRMLDRHPSPIMRKDDRTFCKNKGCDCPMAPRSAVMALVRLGWVLLNEEGGYVLTEPKGVRAATRVWNFYCLKEGKKKLMKAVL